MGEKRKVMFFNEVLNKKRVVEVGEEEDLSLCW